MATLTIDGLTLDVVGTPSWSDAGQHQGRPFAAFIAAQVRVPASVPTITLDKDYAHVVLALDGGGRVEGRGMWRTDSLSSNSDLVSLRFEGDEVVG